MARTRIDLQPAISTYLKPNGSFRSETRPLLNRQTGGAPITARRVKSQLNTFSYSVIALKPDQFSVISPAMARPVATSKWPESWQSKAILTAFGVVTMTLLSALGWSISGHVDIIRSDVSELKGDIKELRTDMKEIRASLAEVAKATALTAQRLDQTNEKLQGLIDETRKRR